jgi:hypothetical protein
MNADGSGQTNVTRDPAEDYSRPAWGPDGDWVVFSSNRAGSVDLWAVNTDGSDARQLTSFAGAEGNAAFSPDSQLLSFDSNKDGADYEIYTLDLYSSHVTQITDNDVADGLSDWRRVSPGSAPFPLEVPLVDGVPLTGTTLTATGTDRWSGTGPITTTRRWLRCVGFTEDCTPTGHSGRTYEVDPADIGSTIRLEITGTGVGSYAYRGTWIGPIATPSPPYPAGVHSVTGTTQPGGVLTVDPGAWVPRPTSFAFRWQRCFATCVDIAGATASSYTVTESDRGSLLAVWIVATGLGGSNSIVVYGPPMPGMSATPPPPPPAAGGGGSGGGGGGGADLSLELKADQTPPVGGAIVYRLRVYGKMGFGATSQANATVVLPAQVRIDAVALDHGPGCTTKGQTVECDLSWVNPGQDVFVVVNGTVQTGGELRATASVWATGEEATSDNATVLTLQVGPRAEPAPAAPTTSGPFLPPATTQEPLASCLVPSVVGKTVAAANAALVRAHCALGKTTTARATRAKRGHVLRQSPAPGTKMPRSGRVALVIGRL